MEVNIDIILKISGFSFGMAFLIIRVIADVQKGKIERPHKSVIYLVVTNSNILLFSLIAFFLFICVYLIGVVDRNSKISEARTQILQVVDGKSLTIDEILRELREDKNNDDTSIVLEALQDLTATGELNSQIKSWQEPTSMEHFTRLYYRP